jgi:hypothetical protein
LTGCPPQNYTRGDGTIESPRKINPRISSDTERIILKALSFDPSQRYQIAQDMIKELQGYNVVQCSPCIYCQGTKYDIQGRLTIGINPACNIVIKDYNKFVSRFHATVYPENGRYWIEDSQSTNGTFLYRNGRYDRVVKNELLDGDMIALCYKVGKGPYITFTYKKGN